MSIKYRGMVFAGYNQPKRTPGATKKSAVLAKSGGKVKLVRFGDPQDVDQEGPAITQEVVLRPQRRH